MSGSSSAIIEHARSGKRYEIRDKALQSIASNASATSCEVAVNILNAEGVQGQLPNMPLIEVVRIAVRVASIQKRVSDLLKLGYIHEDDHRVCKVTKYGASAYAVTEKGFEYLRAKGIKSVIKTPSSRIGNLPSLHDAAASTAALKSIRMKLS